MGARNQSLPCPQGPLLIAVMEYAPTPYDVVTSMQLYIPQVQFGLHIGGQKKKRKRKIHNRKTQQFYLTTFMVFR